MKCIVCSLYCEEHLQNLCGLEVKSSSIQGLGCFATRDIPANTFVCFYTGTLFSLDQFMTSQQKKSRYAARLSDDWIIDSTYPWEGPGRYINHGTQPNTEMVSRRYANGSDSIEILSKQEIKTGEELLLDYGESYWNGDKFV